MALYDVALEDGRSLNVYADNESGALAHAKAAESSRVSSDRNKMTAVKAAMFSAPVKATKLKD